MVTNQENKLSDLGSERAKDAPLPHQFSRSSLGRWGGGGGLILNGMATSMCDWGCCVFS